MIKQIDSHHDFEYLSCSISSTNGNNFLVNPQGTNVRVVNKIPVNPQGNKKFCSASNINIMNKNTDVDTMLIIL